MPKFPIIAAIVGALSIGAAFITQAVPNGPVEICTYQGCQTYTAEEYGQVKTHLAQKYLAGEEMTFEEYDAFTKIVDREIRANGGLHIANYDGQTKQAIYDLLTQ